jgi:hypothetical protein
VMLVMRHDGGIVFHSFAVGALSTFLDCFTGKSFW